MDFSLLPDDIGAEWLIAALGFWGDKWASYANGYKRAADMLVQELSQNHSIQNDVDILVYPILFLYRHYLELRLKQLTLKTSRFLGLESHVFNTHNIGRLWQDLRLLLQKAHEEAGSEEDLEPFFTEIDGCINQYVLLDPQSIAFRYPIDKNSNPTLATIKNIEVGKLANVVNHVEIPLDGAETQIDVWAQLKRDMEQEYMDDFHSDFPFS